MNLGKKSPRLSGTLEHRCQKCEMLDGIKIDQRYHIPYDAGTSKDRKTVYIDKSIPKRLIVGNKMIDPRPFLAIHELTERHAMDMGMSYHDAHEYVATPSERRAVEAHGIDWKKYQDVWERISKTLEQKPYKDLPKDLDPHPYEAYHHDLVKLKQSER